MNRRRDLARQANYWITKADAGLMTADDEAMRATWIDADDAHAKAYARAEALFAAMGAVAASTDLPAEPAHHDRRFSDRRHRPLARALSWTSRPGRRAIGGAIAASLLALVFAGDLTTRWRADAITGIGESRQVALPDGSIALLDSGSAIAVDYGSKREIVLLRGRAAFTVAADRARPFVVEARGGTTTALGTRFIVDRTQDDTRVVVTEHRVRVVDALSHHDVSQGHQVLYRDGRVSKPTTVRVAEADAWTRGRIRFVNRPLRDVVDELGRYHRGYIGMVGGRIGDLRVNGVFSTRDPVSALDAIQHSLGLTSYRVGGALILLHD